MSAHKTQGRDSNMNAKALDLSSNRRIDPRKNQWMEERHSLAVTSKSPNDNASDKDQHASDNYLEGCR